VIAESEGSSRVADGSVGDQAGALVAVVNVVTGVARA
jgi:hypothetical protein